MKIEPRRIALIILDACLVNLAFYSALWLRVEAPVPRQFIEGYIAHIPIITCVTLVFFVGMKMYQRIWEYASLGEMLLIIKATTYSILTIVVLVLVLHPAPLPRSVYIISWLLMNIFIGGSRMSWRLLRDYILRDKASAGKKILIVGAGEAGAMLVREIQRNSQLGLSIAGFVDDNRHKKGLILLGIPVLGNRRDIPRLVSRLDIQEVIIAMPSASGKTVREIMNICQETSARVQILPGLLDSTKDSPLNYIRDIRMEDLLRRKPVRTDLEEAAAYLEDKDILITGAGGSIGSELCRQVLTLAPRRLIMVDFCENNLFEIETELLDRSGITEVHPILLDVKDKTKLEALFKKYRPQVVFHAAAYKHVPMMERYPEEAIKNNVMGTRNVAEMADLYGVQTFILISSDKAVNPTSVMGASKRLAELIIKDLDRTSKTRFAAVRFGNVLGSRGSVIPTFIKQIENGGPVTITHPDMTRYFMTIPEAVALVIQAGAMGRGGEIFVLDMGEPVKIMDLAQDLIKLSGRRAGGDIAIKYIGLRPGEKLHEELFTRREEMEATRHEQIFISKKELDDQYYGISSSVMLLINSVPSDQITLRRLILSLLPEFQGMVDKNPRGEFTSPGEIAYLQQRKTSISR